jgi:hypothetical protein
LLLLSRTTPAKDRKCSFVGLSFGSLSPLSSSSFSFARSPITVFVARLFVRLDFRVHTEPSVFRQFQFGSLNQETLAVRCLFSNKRPDVRSISIRTAINIRIPLHYFSFVRSQVACLSFDLCHSFVPSVDPNPSTSSCVVRLPVSVALFLQNNGTLKSHGCRNAPSGLFWNALQVLKVGFVILFISPSSLTSECERLWSPLTLVDLVTFGRQFRSIRLSQNSKSKLCYVPF